MASSAYYRQKAERCRALLALAAAPEIREQLRLWELEFEDIAVAIDRRRERRRRLRGGWRRLRAAITAPR